MPWRYGWATARKDMLAGLTVAAISLPQAMAYALIAGIDPRFGLYSAIVVTAVASVLGSSSLLINGPTNAISLVVFSAIALTNPASADDAAEAVFVLALLVGAIQILVAVFKLGDLTRYVSDSVVIGFMAGAGLLVALSQLGNLCGLQDRGTGTMHLLERTWLTLSGGPVSVPSLVIGLGTVVAVVLLRRLMRRYHLPRVDMLLVLALAAVVSLALGWSTPGPDGKPTVALLSAVPAGLPMPHIPDLRWSWVRTMSGSAVAVALLGLQEALAIAKSLAIQTREPLDYNRQCFAEGVANLVGGFFRCLPGSGSLTRSSINFHAGAITRWSGVFAAGTVGLVLMLFAPLAHYIPRPALAGILLVTAAGLIDWPRLRNALGASRYDAGLVLTTAFAAVFVGVEWAIMIGTGLSILMFVPRAARLQATELAVSIERVIRERLASDPPCTAMVLMDLEGELFFGAAPELDRHLDELRRRAEAGCRIIVLRVRRTRNPDMVCMERLQSFIRDMTRRDVTVLLCGVREEFARALHNLHVTDWLPAEHVFLENPDALGSSTVAAVRYAYDLLGKAVCPGCPCGGETNGKRELYYQV